MNNNPAKINRIGETRLNNFGSKMTIIEYNNVHNVVVEFENGYKTIKRYKDFINGKIASPYERRLYGIGYMGEGIYKSSPSKRYRIWADMIDRCCNIEYKNKHSSYQDCTVCESWHNFQNFAKWYDENYYEIANEQIHLDKDILVKGNKIYSPQTCCFVPERINRLFIKSGKRKGKYPIGVCYHANKFQASFGNIEGKSNYLGLFSTIDEAFQAYKQAKELLIKEIAEEYKDRIPEKLYQTLLNYQIEIMD